MRDVASDIFSLSKYLFTLVWKSDRPVLRRMELSIVPGRVSFFLLVFFVVDYS